MRKLFIIAALVCVAASCGDDDDDGAPTGPSPPAAAVIRVENFTATATSGAGTFTYRIAFTLRETAGVGATLSDVALTAQTSSGTIGRTFTATESFGTNRIAANGTLSASVSFVGPPVTATSVSVRIPFTDDRGGTGAAEGTTTVTTGS